VYRSTGVLIGNRSSTGVQEIYWGVVVIVLQDNSITPVQYSVQGIYKFTGVLLEFRGPG